MLQMLLKYLDILLEFLNLIRVFKTINMETTIMKIDIRNIFFILKLPL